MTIVSRPADNGSVRGHQAAAAAVLVKFLAYDLPVVTWRIYDHGDGLNGQLDDEARGDEQLSCYLAQWAELVDGTFSRMPIISREQVQWKVSGTYDGVAVEVWTFVSEAFDTRHELPTVEAAAATLEEYAEASYTETMLTAVERLRQLGADPADERMFVRLATSGLVP
jgi:hypothetical protein